ncbi:MAG: UDP-N-acetylglucosamine 2-epimerase (hydrolyzing), partial [Candidatus Heimdallarchaeota archaeon]|nr:UDP-N-acetylglucosamine 2-epimerase (hydrolyzing) [Candidatus Heimdallarchaeota archaeon]
ASIKSVMMAIGQYPDLEHQIVASASALLDRYGSVVDIMRADGFEPNACVHMLIEGETPATMAMSTGVGLLKLPTVFEQLKPDVVVTVGDRFETMATAIAASYMNIPLAHTMGGEVSGSIDENIRHAVTKLSHIHFPACENARERILSLGEDESVVHLVGCPRMDIVKDIIDRHKNGLNNKLFEEGVGGQFDLDQPFIIVSQHPVTTEYGKAREQITETLGVIHELGIPAFVLWPNADAGSEDISRGIRVFREHNDNIKMHFVKNMPMETYISLMNRTVCLIGNSSSAIREGAFIGVPAVNIGTRQNKRQQGNNVINVDYKKDQIKAAILKQITHGQYVPEYIYGNGTAGQQIADILARCPLTIVKELF